MLHIGFAGDGKACGLESTDTELHPVRRHDLDPLCADVVDEGRNIENTGGNRGPELRISREDDDGLKDLLKKVHEIHA